MFYTFIENCKTIVCNERVMLANHLKFKLSLPEPIYELYKRDQQKRRIRQIDQGSKKPPSLRYYHPNEPVVKNENQNSSNNPDVHGNSSDAKDTGVNKIQAKLRTSSSSKILAPLQLPVKLFAEHKGLRFGLILYHIDDESGVLFTTNQARTVSTRNHAYVKIVQIPSSEFQSMLNMLYSFPSNAVSSFQTSTLAGSNSESGWNALRVEFNGIRLGFYRKSNKQMKTSGSGFKNHPSANAQMRDMLLMSSKDCDDKFILPKEQVKQLLEQHSIEQVYAVLEQGSSLHETQQNPQQECKQPHQALPAAAEERRDLESIEATDIPNLE